MWQINTQVDCEISFCETKDVGALSTFWASNRSQKRAYKYYSPNVG